MRQRGGPISPSMRRRELEQSHGFRSSKERERFREKNCIVVLVGPTGSRRMPAPEDERGG